VPWCQPIQVRHPANCHRRDPGGCLGGSEGPLRGLVRLRRGITMHSIILPIVFLMKKKWTVMPIWEKVIAVIVTVVCFCLGCYVTYTSGENLFFPTESVEFPFCESEFENTVYYNYTAAHET
jgi:hypothetical protein